MDAATLGNRIRRARERLGMSQEELAELISRRQYSVSAYESGKQRIFAIDLPKIAEVLDVPVAYFFEEEPVDDEDLLLTEFRRLPTKDARKLAIQLLRDVRQFTNSLGLG